MRCFVTITDCTDDELRQITLGIGESRIEVPSQLVADLFRLSPFG